MQNIVVDTNFILSAIKFKIKMPYGNLIVPSGVVRELNIISKSKSNKGALARAALEIIKKRNVIVVPTLGHVDKAIVNYATAHNYTVATNDKNLIKALKASDIKIIRIRQKKYVVEQ